MSINIAQVGSNTVAKNSGNKDNGTLRVCIATDDVNIADIKSKIETIQSDINTLKTILNDVWDQTSHTLKTS